MRLCNGVLLVIVLSKKHINIFESTSGRCTRPLANGDSILSDTVFMIQADLKYKLCKKRNFH